VKKGTDFLNLYGHGFARIAACIPEVRVSDPQFNADKTIELARNAYKQFWQSFPSWAFRATPTKTFSFRTLSCAR
jgi:hypothetical protein